MPVHKFYLFECYGLKSNLNLNSNSFELRGKRKEEEKEKNQTSPKERRKPSPVANPAQPLLSAQPAKRSGPAPFFFSPLPRGPVQRQQPSIAARVTPLRSSSRSGSAAFVPVPLTSGPRLSAPPSRKPRAHRLQRGRSPACGTAQHQHHPGPVLRQRPLARCRPCLRPTRAAPRPSARGPAFLSMLSPDLHGSFGRD